MPGIENVNFANLAKPTEEVKLSAAKSSSEELASLMTDEEFKIDDSETKIYSKNAPIDEQQILDALDFADFATEATKAMYDKDGNIKAIYNVKNGKPSDLELAKMSLGLKYGADTTSPSDLAKMAEEGDCEASEYENEDGRKGTKYTMPDGSSYIVYEEAARQSYMPYERIPGYQEMECYDENGNLVQEGRYEEDGDFNLKMSNEDGSTTEINYNANALDCDFEQDPTHMVYRFHQHDEDEYGTEITATTTHPDGKTETEHTRYNNQGEVEEKTSTTTYNNDDSSLRDITDSITPKDRMPKIPDVPDIGSLIPEDRMPKIPDVPDIGSLIPENKMPVEPPKIEVQLYNQLKEE